MRTGNYLSDAVRWTIKVSRETDLAFGSYLGAQGMKKGDLSRFVEEAVCWRVLDRTVQRLKNRNQDLPAEELEALIDEADCLACNAGSHLPRPNSNADVSRRGSSPRPTARADLVRRTPFGRSRLPRWGGQRSPAVELPMSILLGGANVMQVEVSRAAREAATADHSPPSSASLPGRPCGPARRWVAYCCCCWPGAFRRP